MITNPAATAEKTPACTGRWDLFFGPDGETAAARSAREKRAKRVCLACPVRPSCREYAITAGEKDGVWAGLTEEELAAERYRRQQVAA